MFVFLGTGWDGSPTTSRASKLPSSAVSEPLLFLGAGATNVIGRGGVQRFYPTRDYDYFGDWLLPTFNHSVEWVETKPVEMENFKSKRLRPPKYGLGSCQHLQDNCDLGRVSYHSKLLIMGEMYNEFFPTSKLIVDQKLPAFLQELFYIWRTFSLENLDLNSPNRSRNLFRSTWIVHHVRSWCFNGRFRRMGI